MTVAFVGVLLAYTSANSGPHTSFVVARQPIAIGHRIEAADLREERIELPASVAAQAFPSTSQVVGSVALSALTEGQLVARSATRPLSANADPGAREFSFAVDRERALNGDLRKGEHIDLLATSGTGADAVTDVIARDVTIVAIGDQGKGNLGSGGKIVITVALISPDLLTRVAHASQVAAVTVVRSTGAADASSSAGQVRLPTTAVANEASTLAATPASSSPSTVDNRPLSTAPSSSAPSNPVVADGDAGSPTGRP